MSPRTGRPKLENPKHIRYSVRLDDEMENNLIKYSEKHGITKVEAIRKGIAMILDEDTKELLEDDTGEKS